MVLLVGVPRGTGFNLVGRALNLSSGDSRFHPADALSSVDSPVFGGLRHLSEGTMSDLGSDDGPDIRLILALIFLLIVVGGSVDLVLDRPTTLWSAHVAFEVLMVGVSLGAAAYLAHGWFRTQGRLEDVSRRASALESEQLEWQRRTARLLEDLGGAISAQFHTWGLTPAESRVALMLLKGLSHKRAARLTGTSDRTVRQHAVAVYRKSGLAGRAELAGFFLESLLLPEDEVLPEDEGKAGPPEKSGPQF